MASARADRLETGRASCYGMPVVLLVMVLAAFALNFLTPMISDDYRYALKGISGSAIWAQYVRWSGRLVADTLSSFVLGLGVPWVADLFNAFAVAALIWILGALGRRLLDVFTNQGGPDAAGASLHAQTPHPAGISAGVMALLFAMYWIANPDLGQTTFWIVGAANYLWTNLFNFGFALAFVTVFQRGRHPLWQALGLCLLAVLAGCSNENTGIVTWVLLVGLTLKFQGGGRGRVWPWIWLFFLGVGICLLVLAPGNYVRENSFQEWYDQSFLWRVVDHFIRRFPDAMFRYWEVFALLWALAYAAGKPVSGSRSRVRQCGADVMSASGEVAWYGAVRGMWLLIGMSLLANAVLLFAPNIPKRALQGGFLYALVAVSILAHHVLAMPRLSRPRVLRAVFILCTGLWLLSFGLMLRAYGGAYQQDQVRVAQVLQGIRDGARHIEIPQYFFTPMLKKRDAFDTFFSGPNMARFYGAKKGTTITEYPVAGPYGPTRPPVRRAPEPGGS